MPTIEFKLDKPNEDISFEQYKQYYSTILKKCGLNIQNNEIELSPKNDSVNYVFYVKGNFFNMRVHKILNSFSKYNPEEMFPKKNKQKHKIINYFPDSIKLKLFK